MIYPIIYTQSKNKFKDRRQAGNDLADELLGYRDKDAIVIALPRGGVPVGFQVAKKLHVPLSVIVSRKIGYPGQEEFGIGAIAEENSLYLDKKNIDSLKLKTREITKIIDEEKEELRRRVEVYRQNEPLQNLENKTVILVDDGLATGSTARAAIMAVRKLKADYIVFATPVSAKQSVDDIKKKVENFVCLLAPNNLRAIGLYYSNFDQVSDNEVLRLLKKATTN